MAVEEEDINYIMKEEDPVLNVDFDNFSKESYINFLNNFVDVLKSDNTALGVPILPKPSRTVYLYQVNLVAFRSNITAAFRGTDLYLIGFKNGQGWFECHLDDTPRKKDVKKELNKRRIDPSKRIIQGSEQLHFTGSYPLMLSHHLHNMGRFKLSLLHLKEAIKILCHTKVEDVADKAKKHKIKDSFARIIIFTSECTRFKGIGDELAKTLESGDEVEISLFLPHFQKWSVSSWDMQYDKNTTLGRDYMRLMKHRSK